MKKIYLSVFCLIAGLSVSFAQGQFESQGLPGNRNIPFIPKGFTSKTASASDSTRWYNFGDAMAYDASANFGDSSILRGNNLFPDSTILVNYGSSGYKAPWIHGLGDVLDVSSNFFNNGDAFPDEVFMTKSSTYSVDSLGFWFIYSRSLGSAVIDTLQFEVAVNASLTTSYFCCNANTGLAIAQNLGVDTVFVKSLPYSYQQNAMDIPGKFTFKFPLTEATLADSTPNGLHRITISTAGLPIVGAGKFVATSVKFIPGYTWTPNVDTLDNKNNVFFISYKESANRYLNYVVRDYNASYIIPINVRYNYGGWMGRFVPSFAYEGGGTPNYSYEHHLIEYLVKCQTGCGAVGVEEYASNDFEFVEINPNPSSEICTLNYQLKKAANTNISIYDITGQEVMKFNNGKQTEGKYSFQINTSAFSAGVYYCSLATESGVLTKKMIVVN